MFEPVLVLDTCALLWLTSGSPDLSEDALSQIENASIVYVSAISGWEISLKFEREQLILPLEPEEWFSLALEKHSLTLYPLDLAVLCLANKLPPVHRDPADRFIIASAVREKAAVVTADENFRKYGIKVIN